MKFLLAQVGQRFEYQGDVYVKASPIVACNVETGKQKLIPRSAVIALCDATNSPVEETKPIPDSLDSEIVNTAFTQFYARVEQLLNEAASVDSQELQTQLEQARAAFLAQLK